MNALTQEEMANQLQLSLNGYANIERGETKLSVERLEQIANIFGIDVTELLSFGEHNSITYNHTHSPNTNNLTIFGNATDSLLESELSKLQLLISHKDEVLQNRAEIIENKNELIEQLKAEIETLKLLVDTLRNNK